MKKYLVIFTALAFGFTSCEKEEVAENTPSYRMTQLCGTTASTPLLAGQTMLAGNVTVSNDAEFLYVTYNTTGNWRLKKTHLYVGACNAIPTNGGGNPKIGLFPYTAAHNISSTTTYTYAIPLASLANCGCVAAHSEVVRLNGNGSVATTQTAWGSGTGIGGNSWAMKFSYCKQSCEEQPS